MPPLRFRSLALLGLALTGCAGMEEMKQTLLALQELQHGLAAAFQEPKLAVNQTNTTLTITFVNSTVADLPDSARAATARAVAEYVRDHYPAYPSLTDVAVGFQSRTSIGIASASKTTIPYDFRTADLGPPPMAPSADTVAAEAS